MVNVMMGLFAVSKRPWCMAAAVVTSWSVISCLSGLPGACHGLKTLLVENRLNGISFSVQLPNIQ